MFLSLFIFGFCNCLTLDATTPWFPWPTFFPNPKCQKVRKKTSWETWLSYQILKLKDSRYFFQCSLHKPKDLQVLKENSSLSMVVWHDHPTFCPIQRHQVNCLTGTCLCWLRHMASRLHPQIWRRSSRSDWDMGRTVWIYFHHPTWWRFVRSYWRKLNPKILGTRFGELIYTFRLRWVVWFFG